jgi:hypothetical protein
MLQIPVWVVQLLLILHRGLCKKEIELMRGGGRSENFVPLREEERKGDSAFGVGASVI